jgi:TonB family protein
MRVAMSKQVVFVVLAPLLPAILASAQTASSRDLVRERSEPARIALVIGNNQYPNAPLRQAINDANDLAQALRDAGFVVQVATDTPLREIDEAVNRLVASLHEGDIGLFFYAGHGFQIAGENYLVPVDFETTDEADAKYRAYSVSRVQERMEFTGARLSILILDACRNNPFLRARAGGTGLAAMNAGRGTFLALATGPGKLAFESAAGRNSVFTANLLSALREPGLALDQVFNRVRERVYEASHRQQLPWTSSSVIGEFRFSADVTPPSPAPAVLPTIAESTVVPGAVDGVTQPRAIYSPQPTSRGEPKGFVELSVTVDTDGATKNITVLQASKPVLAAAAIEAVKRWRFEPGRKDGKPVPVGATLRFQFGSIARALIDELAPKDLPRVGDEGITAPVVLQRVLPDYPPDARKLKTSFSVALYAEVDEAGLPNNVKLLGQIAARNQLEGEVLIGLVQRAVTALQQWRFRSAERNNKPIRVATSVLCR